jgi:hypothetical protein
MRVHFWGVRGDIAAPGPNTLRYGGHTLCTTVSDDHESLCILDAGTGLTALGKAWKKLKPSRAQKQAIFLISHNNWSHTQGIGFFSPFFTRGNCFEFYGCGRDKLDFQDILEAQLTPSLSPLQTLDHLVADLYFRKPDGKPFNWGNIQISTWSVPTLNACFLPLAYRLSSNGRSLVYLPRIEYIGQIDKELVSFCNGVNMIIHGAYYTDKDYQPGNGHSPINVAVELALQTQSPLLLLYYYNPAYKDEDIDQLVAYSRSLANPNKLEIIGAREGLDLEV